MILKRKVEIPEPTARDMSLEQKSGSGDGVTRGERVEESSEEVEMQGGSTK